MFAFTSSTLTFPSFSVNGIFREAQRNDLLLAFLIGAWNHISLEISCFCPKTFILLFLTSTILSIFSAISSSRVTTEPILTNFSLLTWILNGFSYSCWMVSATYNTFSSDILICFGHIVLYSVVDSSKPVSLWSSCIGVTASDLSRKQFSTNMVL